jgi:hypothetical protein
MNKIKNIFEYKIIKSSFFIVLIFSILFSLYGCKLNNNKEIIKKSPDIEYFPENFEDINLPDNRIEIVRFHHTVECKDCLVLGNVVLSILKKDYEDACKNGIITYRSANSELLSNKPLCEKYESLEEDLVFNIVLNNKDQISHHHELWLLASEQKKLEEKLSELLKKEIETISKTK